MMSRAAQTHLMGHMRSVGHVFETPDLNAKYSYYYYSPITQFNVLLSLSF